MSDERQDLKRVLTYAAAKTDLITKFAPRNIPIKLVQSKFNLLQHATLTTAKPWVLRIASSAPGTFSQIQHEKTIPKISFGQQNIKKQLHPGPQRCILPRLLTPLLIHSKNVWKYCRVHRQPLYQLCKWEQARQVQQPLVFLPRHERLQTHRPPSQLLSLSQIQRNGIEIPCKTLTAIDAWDALDKIGNEWTATKRSPRFEHCLIGELLRVESLRNEWRLCTTTRILSPHSPNQQ